MSHVSNECFFRRDDLARNSWRHLEVPPIALDVYNKGDQGLAMIAYSALKERIKFVPRFRRAYYMFDHTECLWKKELYTLMIEISYAVEAILLKIALRYKDALLVEIGKEGEADLRARMACLRMGIERVRSSVGLCKVSDLAEKLLTDVDFDIKLDSVRHLLGVRNGVVNLRTGELRARRPEDMISKLASVEYQTDIDTQWFDQMVLTMMAGHVESKNFLQKLLGYSVTGEIREHVFAMFESGGETLMYALEKVLVASGLCFRIDPEFLCDGETTFGHGLSVRRGRGLWSFKYCSEDGRLKNESVLMISGDVGLQHKDEVLIPPRTCILFADHLPDLDVVTPAIADRLLCIEFPVRIVDAKLRSRIDDNLGAVMKWFVDGAVSYYRDPGLKQNAPQAVEEFTRSYIEDNDTFSQFLMDEFEFGPDFTVHKTTVLDRHKANRGQILSDKQLRTLMTSKGFCIESVRVDGGVRKKGYRGMRVRQDV